MKKLLIASVLTSGLIIASQEEPKQNIAAECLRLFQEKGIFCHKKSYTPKSLEHEYAQKFQDNNNALKVILGLLHEKSIENDTLKKENYNLTQRNRALANAKSRLQGQNKNLRRNIRELETLLNLQK